MIDTGKYKAKVNVTIFGSFSMTHISSGQEITVIGHDNDEGYRIEISNGRTIHTHDSCFINEFCKIT